MKKIIALVLALVMTLSLLPMTAWAETTEQVDTIGGSSNRGAAGVFVFTALSEDGKTLSCSTENVMQDGWTITILCATNAPGFVYLTVGTGDGLVVSDTSNAENPVSVTVGDPIGIWMDGTRKCNVYKVAAPTSTTKWTVARTWNDNGEHKKEEFPLIFDFTPAFKGESTCGQAGVFFFGSLNETTNELVGGNSFMGEQGKVTVACKGAEAKTIFMAASSGDILTVINREGSNVLPPAMNGTWTTKTNSGQYMVCKVYALNVSKPETGSVVEYTVKRSWENNGQQSESFTLVFDFDRQPGSSDSGSGSGGDRIYKEYTTSRGNSIIRVDITPEQAKVIDLPDSGMLTNDTLNVTIKTADPALWAPLLEREDGFTVHYEIFPIGELTNFVPKPQVAEYANSWQLEDTENELGLISLLLRDLEEGHDAFFKEYNAPTARQNGWDFAWSSEDKDGTITIIPNDDYATSAWVWNYGVIPGSETTNAIWAEDGFTLQFAMDSSITNAIKLTANAAVNVSRINLVQHVAKNSESDSIDDLLKFEEYSNGVFKYTENGVLNYVYAGSDKTFEGITADVKAAANNSNNTWLDGDNKPAYHILQVEAPQNCVAKALSGSYVRGSYEVDANKKTIDLEYHWMGLGIDQTFVLTWYNTETKQDYVEQIVVKTPSVDGAQKWLDVLANRIPTWRVGFTEIPADCGAENSYEEGYLLTSFDNDKIIDVNDVLSSQVFITVPEAKRNEEADPEKPVGYAVIAIAYDGTEDPALNPRTAGLVEAFKKDIDNKTVNPVKDIEIFDEDGVKKQRLCYDMKALVEQQINDIEYYYSADKQTRFILLRWDFAEDSGIAPLYEYMEVETTNYYCQWKTVAKKDADLTGPVDKPCVILGDGFNLEENKYELVVDIVPQEMEGKYYCKLHMLKDGDVITQHTGPYKVILPYSFMGEGWNHAKASQLKNAPVINHYNDLHKVTEKITGEYTSRGIEFVVYSFSPFMLTWDETVKENTGGTSGGYYPVVTPDKDTTTEDKTTETKPVVTPTTTPSVEETVTPEVEDTTPAVIPEDTPVDNPVVDEAPADDVEPSSGNAGLWIGIGIVALAAIVVVLAVMAARKKRK